MPYKYSLDSSSKKYICPSCGKKSFVVYVDVDSKVVVDDQLYGRCDRENSCNYHLHPNAEPTLKEKARPENYTPPQVLVAVQIFPDEKIWRPIVDRTKNCISPLHTFLSKTLLIPPTHFIKWGMLSDQDGAGNELTVFVFRDAQGRICNLKWFKYQDDGHRDKNFSSFSLKQPLRPPRDKKNSEKISKGEGTQVEERKYKLCLFGAHLLDQEKKRPVCVVESEKTAVIGGFFYDQFDWVACGSNNGLTIDKIPDLVGRTVYWLNDADKASRMRTEKNSAGKDELRPSSVRHLIEYIDTFHIADLFPDRNDGYDIGDAIVDGLRPEIKATWTKGVNEIATKKVENDDEFDYDLPKGVEFEKVKLDIRKYMHFNHEGRVYIVRKRKSDGEKGGSFYCTDITNFTMNGLGLIDSPTEPRRLIEIKNIHGFQNVLQIPTSAFASATEFTVFIESQGNFQYDGVGTDLKKLRARLYDTMESFEEVESLGWHNGYFLFANGAYNNGKFSPIDKYGFVKLGDKRFYIEALSAITRANSEDWEDEKKFLFKERPEVKPKEWADLFCAVHKANCRIALAWYTTSLFRDLIYKRFKFFPHLFLFGPPGTGKSQVGWSIRATGFVGLVKPFNLNTGTAVAFHREFAHFVNFPAWCDEYDNSIPYERIQALKAAYDGVGHKKSVKDSDKRTKATQVNRSILISGQQLPIADNALFKRVVLLQFNQTEFNDQEKKLFADIQNMEEGGLSHITAYFMNFRKLMEDNYMKEFDVVMDDIMKMVGKMQFEVEDRIMRNSAVILTTIKVLESMIAEMLPYTYAQLLKIVVTNMKTQMGLISSSNETNTFWDMVVFLVREQKIKESEDFVFDEKQVIKIIINREDVTRDLSKVTEIIYLRFSKIIPLYRESFKRQNSNTASPMDRGSLMHYLTNSKPFLGLVSNVNFKDSRTSGYAFDYGMLKAMGVNLGGSESVKGTPPPLAFKPRVSDQPDIDFTGPPPGPDDLPF